MQDDKLGLNRWAMRTFIKCLGSMNRGRQLLMRWLGILLEVGGGGGGALDSSVGLAPWVMVMRHHLSPWLVSGVCERDTWQLHMCRV